MPRRSASSSNEPMRPFRPATTPDDREAQMIDLADQLAERQLREGTASSQVITHYLKLGSSRERLDQELINVNIELSKAKAELMSKQANQEELFAAAIIAIGAYRGESRPVAMIEQDDLE